jgi:hypothetical protein
MHTGPCYMIHVASLMSTEWHQCWSDGYGSIILPADQSHYQKMYTRYGIREDQILRAGPSRSVAAKLQC